MNAAISKDNENYNSQIKWMRANLAIVLTSDKQNKMYFLLTAQVSKQLMNYWDPLHNETR